MNYNLLFTQALAKALVTVLFKAGVSKDQWRELGELFVTEFQNNLKTN